MTTGSTAFDIRANPWPQMIQQAGQTREEIFQQLAARMQDMPDGSPVTMRPPSLESPPGYGAIEPIDLIAERTARPPTAGLGGPLDLNSYETQQIQAGIFPLSQTGETDLPFTRGERNAASAITGGDAQEAVNNPTIIGIANAYGNLTGNIPTGVIQDPDKAIYQMTIPAPEYNVGARDSSTRGSILETPEVVMQMMRNPARERNDPDALEQRDDLMLQLDTQFREAQIHPEVLRRLAARDATASRTAAAIRKAAMQPPPMDEYHFASSIRFEMANQMDVRDATRGEPGRAKVRSLPIPRQLTAAAADEATPMPTGQRRKDTAAAQQQKRTHTTPRHTAFDAEVEEADHADDPAEITPALGGSMRAPITPAQRRAQAEEAQQWQREVPLPPEERAPPIPLQSGTHRTSATRHASRALQQARPEGGEEVGAAPAVRSKTALFRAQQVLQKQMRELARSTPAPEGGEEARALPSLSKTPATPAPIVAQQRRDAANAAASAQVAGAAGVEAKAPARLAAVPSRLVAAAASQARPSPTFTPEQLQAGVEVGAQSQLAPKPLIASQMQALHAKQQRALQQALQPSMALHAGVEVGAAPSLPPSHPEVHQAAAQFRARQAAPAPTLGVEQGAVPTLETHRPAVHQAATQFHARQAAPTPTLGAEQGALPQPDAFRPAVHQAATQFHARQAAPTPPTLGAEQGALPQPDAYRPTMPSQMASQFRALSKSTEGAAGYAEEGAVHTAATTSAPATLLQQSLMNRHRKTMEAAWMQGALGDIEIGAQAALDSAAASAMRHAAQSMSHTTPLPQAPDAGVEVGAAAQLEHRPREQARQTIRHGGAQEGVELGAEVGPLPTVQAPKRDPTIVRRDAQGGSWGEAWSELGRTDAVEQGGLDAARSHPDLRQKLREARGIHHSPTSITAELVREGERAEEAKALTPEGATAMVSTAARAQSAFRQRTELGAGGEWQAQHTEEGAHHLMQMPRRSDGRTTFDLVSGPMAGAQLEAAQSGQEAYAPAMRTSTLASVAPHLTLAHRLTRKHGAAQSEHWRSWMDGEAHRAPSNADASELTTRSAVSAAEHKAMVMSTRGPAAGRQYVQDRPDVAHGEMRQQSELDALLVESQCSVEDAACIAMAHLQREGASAGVGAEQVHAAMWERAAELAVNVA